MNLSLEGKHAMVCGSTQGIGRASAQELAGLGARITLVARNAARLAEVAASLPEVEGGSHDFLAADFSQPGQLAEKLSAYFEGGERIHILINNTGGPPGGPVFDAEPEAFRIAFNQHLICNQVLAQAVVPGMRDARYGRIINIISTSVKQPLDGLGVSNTIRGAVANWAKTMANELGRFGITVNNILPGATETERLRFIIASKAASADKNVIDVEQGMQGAIPAGRFGKPEEIAWAVAFLASPAASYINGINLPVDGGRTRSL
jgi:3-oxoacyl-[acyl-carrier protein] reductase